MLLKFTTNFFFIFYLFGNHINAQTKVETEGRARDVNFYKTQNIIPIFALNSDTVEENNGFGVESKFKNQKKKIALPANVSITPRNGYGYIYYGDANNTFAKGYLLFLITNNSRNRSPSLLYIDRNNDYDLNNDGAPDTVKYTEKENIVFLKNEQEKSARHILILSRFDWANQIKYIQMADTHYSRHSGDKKYMGTFYAFREQRLNVLAANYNGGNDSFTLGFKDDNCNGLFNDEGIDHISISSYRSDKFSGINYFIGKNNTARIETAGHIYDLTNITADGSSFKIEEVFNQSFKNQLNAGVKVPHFKYDLADTAETKKRKLCKLRKKPTYILFSYSYADNFDLDTANLRIIYEQYGNRINLLFLNSGDVERQAKKLAIVGNLPYTCGISDANIDKEWFIQTKPTGFLLDKKLRLNTAGMSTQELLLYLQRK